MILPTLLLPPAQRLPVSPRRALPRKSCGNVSEACTKLAVVCVFSFASLADAQGPGDEFRRGDANGDGSVNLADVGFISEYVNRGGDPPACFDAADADDDGDVDNGDATRIFGWYAQGGPPPPAPGPFTCDEDPTSDSLDCDSYDCG